MLHPHRDLDLTLLGMNVLHHLSSGQAWRASQSPSLSPPAIPPWPRRVATISRQHHHLRLLLQPRRMASGNEMRLKTPSAKTIPTSQCRLPNKVSLRIDFSWHTVQTTYFKNPIPSPENLGRTVAVDGIRLPARQNQSNPYRRARASLTRWMLQRQMPAS